MIIGRIFRAISTIGSSSDFEAYFMKLQDRSCSCASTKDEARRDYADMMRHQIIV